MEENIPSASFLRSFMTPLFITILGIMGTFIIIVVYHFVLIKFCRSRQQETLNTTLPLVNDSSLQTGVDQKLLQTIPIFPYSLQKDIKQFHDDQAECVVCIGELEEGDMVRLLPTCKHTFHVSCIDKWFQEHASCPVCRSPINPPTNDNVSLVDDDENNDNNNELPSSQDQDSHVEDTSDDCNNNVSVENWATTTEISEVQEQPRRVLCHSVTLALPIERKSRKRATMRELKRSLSLDHQPLSIVIDIDKECHKDLCSSSSSSTKWSMKKFDCASSRLIRSLSLFHRPQSGGVLPF